MRAKYIDKLKKLLPPPAKPPLNEANWQVAEEILGLQIPADFKEFVQTYGNAIWCDSFKPVYPGNTRRECEEYKAHLLELLKLGAMACGNFTSCTSRIVPRNASPTSSPAMQRCGRTGSRFQLSHPRQPKRRYRTNSRNSCA